MSSDDLSATPPDLREIATAAINNLLPSKSQGAYEKEYNKFMIWCNTKDCKVVTENVLLAYFDILSKTYKSSTLWKSYSMLKSVLNVRQNIDISKYTKLQCLLKRLSTGYEAKKSKILEYLEIEKFINEAPNYDFLAAKVALIIGYSGACRREELILLTTNDIEYKDDSIFIKIFKTKTNVPRFFAITNGTWINLIKHYASLRPNTIKHNRFLIFYRNGRCTVQPIGINTVGEMPKRIAKYLQLNNADLYSGHCFRRSSASHLANNGGDLLTIKRHGGWKSSSVAEGYVEASKKRRIEIADMLMESGSRASTSTPQIIPKATAENNSINQNHKSAISLTPLNNSSGISINTGNNCSISIVINNSSDVNKTV